MSRLVPAQYLGATCPVKATLNRVLGPNAGTLSIEYDGDVTTPVGSPCNVQIASATFHGIIQRVTTDMQDRVGFTTVQAVDWRDRLHDMHFYAAFNMVQEDGRWYHIFPDDLADSNSTSNSIQNSNDWSLQRRTYMKREIQKNQWGQIQNDKAKQTKSDIKNAVPLFSSATILNILADRYNFSWTASSAAADVLNQCYLENIDWNKGTLVINCVDELLNRSRLQFTAVDQDQIYVSMRGVADNPADPPLYQLCTDGLKSAKFGQEVNQKGRRAVIIGGFNQYEYICPCIPDWNPNWTFSFCYDGWTRAAYLRQNKLSELSRLQDMDTTYQDYHTFNGKQRNLMTIKEYLETICFRVYVVNPNFAITIDVDQQLAEQKGLSKSKVDAIRRNPSFRFEGSFDSKSSGTSVVYFAMSAINNSAALQDVPALGLYTENKRTNNTHYELPSITDIDSKSLYTGKWLWTIVPKVSSDYQQTILDPTNCNDRDNITFIGSLYPISRRIVSDSSHQSIVYATSRKIPRSDNPFPVQINFVPQDDGVNVEQEEVIDIDSGHSYYRLTVRFNEPKFRVNTEVAFINAKAITPDHVAVLLSFDGQIYQYQAGDMSDTFMVREKKKEISSLRKAYIDGNEMEILCQNYASIYSGNNGAVPVSDLVFADDLAAQIAFQMLNHYSITESGSFALMQVMGFVPDGIIESTQIQYDGEFNMADESVTMTSEMIDPEIVYSVGDYQTDTFKVLWQESRLVMERLKAAEIGMVEKGGVGKVMKAEQQGLNNPGAFIGPGKLMKAQAEDDQLNAIIPLAHIQLPDFSVTAGQIMMMAVSIDASYLLGKPLAPTQ